MNDRYGRLMGHDDEQAGEPGAEAEVEVDTTRCDGSGCCAELAPDVFAVAPDGLVLLLRPRTGAEHWEAVRGAAASCPSRAIVARQVEAPVPHRAIR